VSFFIFFWGRTLPNKFSTSFPSGGSFFLERTMHFLYAFPPPQIHPFFYQENFSPDGNLFLLWGSTKTGIPTRFPRRISHSHRRTPPPLWDPPLWLFFFTCGRDLSSLRQVFDEVLPWRVPPFPPPPGIGCVSPGSFFFFDQLWQLPFFTMFPRKPHFFCP